MANPKRQFRLKIEGLLQEHFKAKDFEKIIDEYLEESGYSDRMVFKVKLYQWKNIKFPKPKNTFEEKLEENNFTPPENWSHGWLKNKEASIFVKNERSVDYSQLLDTIWEKYSTFKVPPKIKVPKKGNSFDRLIITDVHIGLEPNKKGTSMYDMKWGTEEIEQAKQAILAKVFKHKSSDILYIDNLGDYLDGFEGFTTRGGHKLEQNLSTEMQFEIGVDFILGILAVLSKHYKFIYLTNITNDNHSGVFGMMCYNTIKRVTDLLFPMVEVYNQEKFIEHYVRGKHIYLLCHGKDRNLMKYGFSAIPSKDNIHKIENYIGTHRLNTSDDIFIEFSKGDSHIYHADNGSSDIFSYVSYPTLAPNSEYITTNFKKGRRGFVFCNVAYDKNEQSIHPLYL